jgi:hypothetical protein
MLTLKSKKTLLIVLVCFLAYENYDPTDEGNKVLPFTKRRVPPKFARSKALDPFPLTCEPKGVRSDMDKIYSSLEPAFYLEEDKPVRHAVVNIFGSLERNESARTLKFYFPGLDEYLLSPYQLTYVFLYDFPNMSKSSLDLEDIFRNNLKWVKRLQGQDSSQSADGEWQSLLGTRIIVKGRKFELPLYLQREPELLNNLSWLGCVGIRRSPSYNLYSGAVFSHHILSDPSLDEFDYVFKVDLDVEFFKKAPFSPSLLMKNSKCLFLHSTIKSEKSDCNTGVIEATKDFANILGRSPYSQNYEWCKVPYYFYGNFVGLNLEFYSSPAQQYFSRWLYECVKDGYFRYRWGDQAPFPMYLCLTRVIPNLVNNSDVCSVESWRGSIFEHY